MTQQFITMTITITIKIPVPPAPTGAKAPEPVFLFREGQPPLCRCKVRYGCMVLDEGDGCVCVQSISHSLL